MTEFHTVAPTQLKENVFSAIGQDWMLITAKKPDGTFNTMTASWGGMGILWNKPVAFCFIRPQRYTQEFVEAADTCTLSFFGNAHREDLTLLGRVSGRDGDKIARTSLTPMPIGDSIGFAQADLILHCKKLYRGALEESGFLDPSLLSHYAQKDFHCVRICEILNAYHK